MTAAGCRPMGARMSEGLTNESRDRIERLDWEYVSWGISVTLGCAGLGAISRLCSVTRCSVMCAQTPH